MKIDFDEINERIAKCQKILDADPSSQIFAALADAYRKKGELEKALQIGLKGIEDHPDYGSAYMVVAKTYLDMGNYGEAERYLHKAVEVGGRTRSADLLEAEILMKQEQFGRAKTLLERLHNSDPKSETIKNLLTKAMLQSNTGIEPPKPISSAAVSPEHPPRKTYDLSHTIGIIKILPRVLGVVAVTREGMVVEGQFDGLLPRDELGALASGAFNSVEQAISKLHFGAGHEILIEADQSKLWMFNRGRLIIVISTRDDVNLGSLKLKLNEIFSHAEF